MTTITSAPPAAPALSRHWASFANQWDHIVAPLRPSADDLAVCEWAIRDRADALEAPSGVVLGATPEFARLPWPRGSSVIAVDRSEAMLDLLWPGTRESAVCADWSAIPVPDASQDVVLCDGGLNMLPFPSGQHAVLLELRRILRPGGVGVFRLYVASPAPERPDEVLQDLVAGRVPNLSVLKLRLWAALQDSPRAGVLLGDVWRALRGLIPELSTITGWPAAQVATLDLSRDSTVCYHLFTLADACWLVQEDPGGFDLEALHVPSYAHGDATPSIVVRRLASQN